ncbi:MAG TPA: patatin-like phospholipase family protein [Caulobacteraceae bacterium]|nr:patatin-like phospholipase family protein [Caulobacteraceae bacterium]
MNIHVSETQLRRHKSHARRKRPPFDCIALLLQGGGALGAYQGGVYQALAEAELHPDWVAGISIGAINSALIAGNPPELRVDRLRSFWDAITLKPLFGALSARRPSVPAPPQDLSASDGTPADHIGDLWMKVLEDTHALWGGPSFAPRGYMARNISSQASALIAAALGAPGMFAPRILGPWLQPPGTLESTSYYDTSDLRATLERFVDFDRINAGEMRFSVGAVNVTSGNFVYFDNSTHTIGPEHVMASGALPPGFPAIEIEGEYYWDGGLVSNTPLQWVLETELRQDTIAFQVDLWNARGSFPRTMSEVETRLKEIQYSSRTRANSNQFKQVQQIRKALGDLLSKLPEELRSTPEYELLSPQADRKVYNLIQLIYRSKDYEGGFKDHEFSQHGMQDHWRAGYHDTIRTLRHPEVLERPTTADGVFAFDLAIHGRE